MKYPNLQAYPRPARDNRIGIHWNGSAWVDSAAVQAEIPRLDAAGVRHIKLLSANDASLNAAAILCRAGFNVIVRLYRKKPHSWYVPDVDTVRKFVAAGVHYFEPGNEPNLTRLDDDGSEWSGPFNLESLMRQWQAAKHNILAAGGIPLFYALSPGGDAPFYGPDGKPNHRYMYDAIFRWLAENEGPTALDDCGIAAHPRPLNHPLDYPYDRINQAEHAGATLADDSTCFLMVNDIDRRVRELTGGRSVPIFATEHGCSIGDAQDSRYPVITPELHARRNVTEMLEAYRTGVIRGDTHNLPLADAFFAGCVWLWGMFGHYAFPADNWIANPLYDGKNLPAVQALIDENKNRPFTRSWHSGAPPEPKPEPVPNPAPPQLNAWKVAETGTGIIQGVGVPAEMVQAQLDRYVFTATAKPELGPGGFEIAGLGAGLWTVRAPGYATATVRIAAGKGAFLTPVPGQIIITPPPPEPKPEPTPAPNPAPEYTFRLGFEKYALEHPALGLVPLGNDAALHPSGDVVQAVRLKDGRRGMLLWYHPSGPVQLDIREAK